MKIRIGKYKKNRKVKIEIESFDTWNMDHTLALIISPMLVQLQAKKAGAPPVENEDVPEHLRWVPSSFCYEEAGNDPFWFDRWDYVLTEMTFAFQYLSKEDSFLDPQADERRYNRVKNGLRLFGKYYLSLWD